MAGVGQREKVSEGDVGALQEPVPPEPPFSIRIMGSAEAVWSQDSTWADLTQHIEVELEEKILRYRLTLKDRP